jgi:3-oxoacyl-[acyl-carrier-protein] synthase-3
MGNFSIKNVQLKGVSVCVPKIIVKNSENTFFDADEVAKFSKSTGVYEFRSAEKEVTTADLGFEAANRLLNEMGINRNEIDILVFVSQTPDFANIPNTAPILQDRLKLSEQCITFDIPLGCSGFVYGLSVVSSFLQNEGFRKGLLLFGDTLSKVVNVKDKSTSLLFGDAAGAVLLERDERGKKIIFNLGSDGSGHKAIIIPDGGFRNQFNANSLIEKEIEKDIVRTNCDIVLDGMDVFSFGISQAPKTVKELYEFANISNEEVDFAVFHQANLMMNEMIRKKMKLESEKVPCSLEKFGNTSSASIPITMVTELKSQLEKGKNRLLLCGFGVGLSWGTCYLETENLKVLDLIEL